MLKSETMVKRAILPNYTPTLTKIVARLLLLSTVLDEQKEYKSSMLVYTKI